MGGTVWWPPFLVLIGPGIRRNYRYEITWMKRGGKEGNLEVGYLRKRAWNDRIRSQLIRGNFYEFATILTKSNNDRSIEF